MKNHVDEYYSNSERTDQVHERAHQKAFNGSSQTYHTKFIKPVLNFKEGKKYILKSPFIAQNSEEGIRTIFAYPSLSKYDESVEIDLKAVRVTPNWMAVGISFGKS